MRLKIISGTLGGRQFEAPPGHKTHPMSEKARGAIFNILGDVEGMSVLDAFSGSGALAFEALSRGASKVVGIDVDKSAHLTMISNARTLGVDGQLKLTRANINSWIDNNPSELFDIVFCDPPYDKLSQGLLVKVAERARDGGIVVYSLPPESDFRLDDNFSLLTHKEYGDATLAFYRRMR